VTPEEKDLIQYRLKRAHEAIEEAHVLFKTGHLNACVNRLYYSCFYVVYALLLTKGISTSKHTHLRSLLHRDYIKSGMVAVDMGKHFDLLFNRRQESDYADYVTFKEEEVVPWFERTRSFVRHIEQLIETMIET
jgi:uncharacterized protein (UPF0332 family)